jgi:hypothetical protein
MRSATTSLTGHLETWWSNVNYQGSGCRALPCGPCAPNCCLTISDFREHWVEDSPVLPNSLGGWRCWEEHNAAHFGPSPLSVTERTELYQHR